MTSPKLLLTLMLTCIAVMPCKAASPTPDDIIAAFFGPAGLTDKEAYYTGEMMRFHATDLTLGELLKPGVSFASRRLPLSPEEAPVYAVTLSDGVELMDWYAYFAPDGVMLKLRAVRALGLSGIPHMLMQALARERSRSAEQEWDYQNLHIAFLPDIERLGHFRIHLSELDALKVAIDARDDTIRERMRALHLRGWERNELGQLQVRVGGGLLNNVVGILYVPTGESPPPISEDHYIYIEHVEGPWYVYKTT